MKVRLIFHEPARGAWNMAVDEALLASAGEGSPTLRIYGWSEPTLSLGYFQKYADRREHAASLGCAAVRRPSGGGAILHDREWTYSFTLPLTDRAAGDRLRLYHIVHAALVEALNARGAPAKIHQSDQSPPEREPFLCFQRRAQGDVLLGDHKICGSAQRRGKSAVLQHGSILLSASPAAPELIGIQELTEHRISLEELQRDWLNRLAAALGANFEEEQLAPEELAAAALLETRKHAHPSWIERR
jgi:lipoate-protein ligase A